MTDKKVAEFYGIPLRTFYRWKASDDKDWRKKLYRTLKLCALESIVAKDSE